MPRYFVEVVYKGTAYSGFQVQENANSVQAEIEKAFSTCCRRQVIMTGSSRTDTGVHALQNFLHFDYPDEMDLGILYNINAVLPADIAVKNIFPVDADAHCRYDAEWREYRYCIYKFKDPFLHDRGYYYPYPLDIEKLQIAAKLVMLFNDFSAFSKRSTQVKTFLCTMMESEWMIENNSIIYQVKANRFLRGMVKGLVGTMLQVGRNKISIEEFQAVIENKNTADVDFSVPGQGLFLMRVKYPEGLLANS